MTEPKTARKRAPAKKTTTPRKRGPVAPPKPPVLDREQEVTPEGPAPVSDDNATPENAEDKPKRGRKPNVVGQANARFQKARTRLEKAQAKADKVQSVQDELNAAKEEFAAAQEEYRDAFTASLNNTVPADDDGDDES